MKANPYFPQDTVVGGDAFPPRSCKRSIEVKEANPRFGIKRISQFLKRSLFLSASPETVCKTLHDSSLNTAPPNGQTRTQGTGALYARNASSLSRREIQSAVVMTLHDLNAFHRRNLRRIRWNMPNVAWSMDHCEYEQHAATGAKVYMNSMQDLASLYSSLP